MYKCCLCGKLWTTEKEVVKCVNRCGRALPHNSKEIPSYEIVNIESEVEDVMSALRARGVRK